MTYSDFKDVERFAGRLEAEKIAARYVAVQRIKLARLAKERDERKRVNDA